MTTRKTKAMLEEELAAMAAEKDDLARQIEEAKRQQTQIPVTKEATPDSGSYAIDHLTLMDNHEAPDTNVYPREQFDEQASADLSFWGGSWTWVKAERAYGDKPEDKWFVNPSPKLIGEVMSNTPTVFHACKVALEVGEHQEQLEREIVRHIRFLQDADQNEIVSECLDYLKAYQARFIEAVQRYLGQVASYNNQLNRPEPTSDAEAKQRAELIANAKLKRDTAGDQCRSWAAHLLALVRAYHEIVTDERAYNLTFNFSPTPPANGQPASREYSLYRYTVTQTLNTIGRRLARSVKTGSMDAERYRIPRPWLAGAQLATQIDADSMLSDMN